MWQTLFAMKVNLSLAFVLLLSIYSCSSTTHSNSASNPQPFSQILGISTHLDMCKDPLNAMDMSACTYQLQQLKSAGVVYVRTDFTMAEIKPQQGGFAFTGYDSLVNAVLSNGMQITAILDCSTSVNQSACSPPDTPSAVANFTDFAYQVALHYKGKIQRYELWNEENTTQFWPPAANPKAYGALLEAVYPAIKSADPNALVAFGGVLMKSFFPSDPTGDTFLDQILTLYPDLGHSMDAVAFHPYMNYPPSVAPDYSSSSQLSFDQMCDNVKAVLKKHAVKKPLWITEVGWPTYQPVGEAMQARWLVRTYLEAVEQGIDTVHWYDFIDGTGCSAPVQECYFGLFNYITAPSSSTPPQPKQSFLALQTMYTVLNNAYFNQDVAQQFQLTGARVLYFTSGSSSKKTWVFFNQHGIPPQTALLPVTGLTFYDISGTTFTPQSAGSGYALTVTTSPVYAVKF